MHDVAVHVVLEHFGEDVGASSEIVDRLEQRNDVELRRSWLPVVRCTGEADLFEEHGHFEHVAHVVRHRDHVVRHDAPPHPAHGRGSGFEDRQLGHGALGEFGVGVAQQPRRVEFGRQDIDSLGDIERQVVVADTGLSEQIGHHLFVHRRVLSEIEPTQVGAEHRHTSANRCHHRVGKQPCTVTAE